MPVTVPDSSTQNGCPVCRSARTRADARWKSYTILTCNDCQVRFAAPLPGEEELRRFYQGFLFEKPDDKDIERLTAEKQAMLRRLFTRARSGARGKRFLDFGGGTGVCIDAARRLGWDAWYHDLDEHAVEYVRARFQVEDNRILRGFDAPGDQFDDILADNVIEHVPDPAGLIRNLYSRLRPGGTVVFRTPRAGNNDSWLFPRVSVLGYLRNAVRYNGIRHALRWSLRPTWACDPPRHCWSFTPGSLVAMTQQLGIAPDQIEITSYHVPLLRYSLTRSVLSFRGRVPGFRSIVKRVLVLPLVVVELVVKLLQALLRQAGLLTPGGLALTIHKPGDEH
jgi:SAM-dependent methyltransferase